MTSPRHGRTCSGSEDITYIPTRAGWVYAAFVLDAATREIVGWQVTNHLRASLARDALDMALSSRLRAGQDVPGLIHHSDRGVQYRAVSYGKSLADSKAVASVGSKGDPRTTMRWQRH
ncbi:DDE-type integrase/transposase/recombinase [Corynebacterium variabile]|uniref:DDE-type integrase/transposase/recombinase n=1 Tax=Corynebacterium variabile TaxID=1727 RepID=UPI003FD217CD